MNVPCPWKQSRPAVRQGRESPSHPTGSREAEPPQGPPTSGATPRRCRSGSALTGVGNLGPPRLAALPTSERSALRDPRPRTPNQGGRCPADPGAAPPPRLTLPGSRSPALSPRPRAGTHRAGAARTPPARSNPRAAPWRGARAGSAARGREDGALMARPRPWPAHPGRLGPAPQRRPGLPPPSSQPAGPPGRAVRLRGLAPPPVGGVRSEALSLDQRRGLGSRGRDSAAHHPQAVTATAARAGQRQARAGSGRASPSRLPRRAERGRASPLGALSGVRAAPGALSPGAVSLEESWKARPYPQVSQTGALSHPLGLPAW